MKPITLAIASLFVAPIFLSACGSDEPSSVTNEPIDSVQNAPNEGESATMADCPSAANAKEVVTYFSVPVASRDELDASMFALTFTNALGEVVTLIEDDPLSEPCRGSDEVLAMAQLWSDITIEITENSESVVPDDQDLQEIADLGNEWLSAIERDDLHFALEADPANVGN